MIFIVAAECARCGTPLKIYPGIEDGPDATGDLCLHIGRAGIAEAQALCKNIVVCDENRARSGRPA
jgi:hypothetical protein